MNDHQNVSNSLITVLYYSRTTVASLFSVSQSAHRTNIFILAKKFQSSPKPNVLDKFFLQCIYSRLAFEGPPSRAHPGRIWCPLVLGLSRFGERQQEIRGWGTMRKSTRTRRRRKRERKDWLCCSQVYTTNLALMFLPLSLRGSLDLPNNDITPLWGTRTGCAMCVMYKYIHDTHTFIGLYVQISRMRDFILDK